MTQDQASLHAREVVAARHNRETRAGENPGDRRRLPRAELDDRRAPGREKPRYFRRQAAIGGEPRSEEHTAELQSHSFIAYAGFCLKKKKIINVVISIKDNMKNTFPDTIRTC